LQVKGFGCQQYILKTKNHIKIFASINLQEKYVLVLNTIYSETKVVAVRGEGWNRSIAPFVLNLGSRLI
jgi:hypothetical protein